MGRPNKTLVELRANGLNLCTKCKEIKSIKHFDIKSRIRPGFRFNSKCKTCESLRRADIAERQRQNPEWYCRKLTAQIKHRAKVISVPFDITPQDLFELWTNQKGLCYYTKKPMNFLAYTANRRNPHIDYPSIDRKDPKLGYTKENIAWCCYGINRMKNELTEEQLIQFCKQVLER